MSDMLFFNFREGLLSSLFSKNPSKCLKSAMLPLKPPKYQPLAFWGVSEVKLQFWGTEKKEKSEEI